MCSASTTRTGLCELLSRLRHYFVYPFSSLACFRASLLRWAAVPERRIGMRTLCSLTSNFNGMLGIYVCVRDKCLTNSLRLGRSLQSRRHPVPTRVTSTDSPPSPRHRHRCGCSSHLSGVVASRITMLSGNKSVQTKQCAYYMYTPCFVWTLLLCCNFPL